MAPRTWLTGLLRPSPADDSTEKGRAKGRQQRVILAMTASSGARVISMATGFIAVPLTLNYLGSERYGLWMVISSLAMAMNFADLGLGNSLVNTLAEAHGRRDRAAARVQVSTAFFLFTGIALSLLIAFWSVYPFVDWARAFNVQTPEAAREIGPALWCFVVCVLAGLVVGIVSRIELAYQKAAEAFIKEGTNRVILATDGDLNVGVTSDDALVKLIKEKAAGGTFLTVLGFGEGNLKDGKLEQIADNGNGMYGYIDSVRDALWRAYDRTANDSIRFSRCAVVSRAGSCTNRPSRFVAHGPRLRSWLRPRSPWPETRPA